MKEVAQIQEVIDKHLIPDLDVRHTLTTPVFVIGHARSGTTIIGNLVRKYLNVNFGPESQFFFRLQRDLPKYGDLNRDENYRSLVEDISRERCFALNQFGFKVDVDQVVLHAGRTYAGAIDAIYRQYAKHNGMTRWGDKTPSYVEHLAELNRLFPGAQYIHIIRDGRDVALSNFDVFFGAKNTVVAAFEWKRSISQATEFFQSIDERYIEVRYEDFLMKPAEELARLMDFLAIDDRTGEVEECFRREIAKEVMPTNFDKWKRKLSDKQQLRFEQVAQQKLIDMGYEVIYPRTGQMSQAKIGLWQLVHRLQKYSQWRPWVDNFYQLKLRLNSLLKPKRS